MLKMFKQVFKRKYNYHISFFLQNDAGATGHGNIGIEFEEKINTHKRISKIERLIEEKYGFKKVIVLNFIRVKKS